MHTRELKSIPTPSQQRNSIHPFIRCANIVCGHRGAGAKKIKPERYICIYAIHARINRTLVLYLQRVLLGDIKKPTALDGISALAGFFILTLGVFFTHRGPPPLLSLCTHTAGEFVSESISTKERERKRGSRARGTPFQARCSSSSSRSLFPSSLSFDQPFSRHSPSRYPLPRPRDIPGVSWLNENREWVGTRVLFLNKLLFTRAVGAAGRRAEFLGALMAGEIRIMGFHSGKTYIDVFRGIVRATIVLSLISLLWYNCEPTACIIIIINKMFGIVRFVLYFENEKKKINK